MDNDRTEAKHALLRPTMSATSVTPIFATALACGVGARHGSDSDQALHGGGRPTFDGGRQPFDGGPPPLSAFAPYAERSVVAGAHDDVAGGGIGVQMPVSADAEAVRRRAWTTSARSRRGSCRAI